MSTEGGDVKFRFSGDSGPVLNALQDIQNAGAKTGDKVALSVGKGSTALGGLAKSGGIAGTQLSKLGAAMGPLGGILARISPEAGAAAASIAGLTSASSTAAAGIGVSAAAMGVALGVVAAAAASVYVAYRVLTQESEIAAAQQKIHAQVVSESAAGYRALESAELAEAVASGRVTEARGAELRAYMAEETARDEYTKAHAEQRAALEASAESGQKWADTLSRAAPFVTAVTGSTVVLNTAIDYFGASAKSAADSLVVLNDAEVERFGVISDETSATIAADKATRAKTEADKAASKAVDARREALQLLNDAQSAEAAAAKANASTYAAVMAELQATQHKAATSQLDDIDQINTARMDEVTRLRTAAAAAIAATQEGTDARAELERQLADTIAAVHTEADAKVLASTDKLVASQKAAAEATTKAWEESAEAKAQASREAGQAILGAEASVFGSLSDLYRADAESKAEQGKKGAKDAFAVSKAFALSSALVSTALAITNALATPPFPVGAALAIGAAVSGGVQIAAILSEKPSFHAGGMYPDEANAKVLGGEPILNRQTAARMGLDTPGAVNDANHAGAGGGMGGVTVLRIGRLEAREIVRTDVAARGLIVQTAKAAASMAGNLAGRTGRRPIA